MEHAAADIRIRLADSIDAPAVAAVLSAAFADYRPLYTAGGYAATTPGPDEVRRRMSEGPVWVATEDGRVAGTGSAVVRDGGLYVRGMAVQPEARGLGIGRLLLEQIQTWALVHRSPRLYLSTTPFLTHAIRLYETFGFRRTDEGPHDLSGTPLFTMEKKWPEGVVKGRRPDKS